MQIPSPQLVLTVAKSDYRRVIRKVGVERRRPFGVLSPVLVTTSRDANCLGVESATLRATRAVRIRLATVIGIEPKLSPVSVSRAAWVIECCERSFARNRRSLRAIGQHGSIAVIERFIKTLKDETTRRVLVPFHSFSRIS